jgi:amino acid adenylation domain-containing protein/thioester reductase-like protein
LFVCLPALCADTDTLNNLVYELSRSYTACLQGDELSDEPLQYADFAEWQNELLESDDAEIGREYWRKQDISAFLELQLPDVQSGDIQEEFTPQFITSTIEPNLVLQIEALAEKYDTSASTVLLSCWQALLWRMTGQPDMVVGTAFDGRKYEELQGALGLFAKYLPLHCHFDENLRLGQLLTQVNESVKHVHKWQECFTWEQIPDAEPFFPVCFDFGVGAGLAANFCSSQITFVQNPPFQGTSGGDVSFSIYKQYACIERFKIKLSCVRRDNSLIAEFHYDANLLRAEDIQRWADLFHKIVESAANNPEAAIAQLEVLSDRARHQLLVEFNQTQADYPRDKCIHHLIEEQAQRNPDNIAVAFGNQELTYRELNARANQLAHYLQKLGVGADVLVGICLERSLEMAIGILGILKAGGAYLPLDPSYPQERLAFMLSDARVSVLLATEDVTSRLSDDFNLNDQNAKSLVCLDTAWETIARESNENPNSGTTSDNLAYVIYTSGSTGKPKGVEITHRNLVHSTTARINYYQEPVTSFLLLSSFAFDSSVAGIFWTLCQGGTLYLPEEGLQREVPKLIELIAQNHVSHLLSLPSLYALVLEQAKPEQLVSLRAVIVAGEPCPQELVERHVNLGSETSLFNEYGPTEGTVWSSVYNCCSGEQKAQIPIGRAIANTQIYLLDSYLQPVPIGACGELYISGDGLARGYLQQPSMTAAKFIPNLFSDRPGMRLYKTGDLARYLADGNIEFLGRIDEQVKIRGFRIELGEIEAVISQHQAVRDAAVIAREDVPGDKRLVAYIVPDRESPLTMGELRLFLKEKLPDYMVPSAFVLLKQLPLAPNGKLLRRALPAPEQVRPEFAGIFVAPRTPLEEALAGIWAEILGIQQVGVHDNFFELGGHSLLTTQLLAKVREAIHVDVSLRSLLELPTVAGLAEKIEKIRQSQPTATSVLDLNAEAILDPAIRADGSLGQPATEPRIIFLTGATGFLGAFLLYELLQQSQADIYCLVRSPDAGSGKKRLQSSLDSYSLWDESFSDRIVPVVGSLSDPLLGLAEEQFQVLASQVDVIYHNGAWVNFIYPYETLKAANVLGTEEVLRLASQVKLKPVHFISTTSVFPTIDATGKMAVGEQEICTQPESLDGGYSQSKWVAEKLVMMARERGIPVSIYRPGRISGHSETGACNANDFLYRAIIGCIELGSAPEGDIKFNIAPADYVSRAIVHLSRQPASLGKAFHLVNPRPLHLSELVSWIRSLGYPLQQVNYDSWREELLAIAASSPDHPIYPLVPLFPGRVSRSPAPNSTAPQFDCQNTLAGLAGTSIICPPADTKLLRTYFSYLMQSGFLDAPSAIDEPRYSSV